jgi:hypothetical protein
MHRIMLFIPFSRATALEVSRSSPLECLVMDEAVVGSHAYTAGDDAKDLADTDMRRQVWAGVVPMNLVYGESILTPGNLVKEVPRYTEEWREDANEKNAKYSKEVAMRNAPKK